VESAKEYKENLLITRRQELKKIELETIVRLCDAHIPYHDEKVLNLALNITKSLRPAIVIIDEWIDFYSLSRFDKDPKRKLQLQDDIDLTRHWLAKLRKTMPKVKIIMIESNHDRRLRKYLQSKAEELSGLRCLRLEELLELPKLGIEYRQNFFFRGVLFKHGSIVRNQSGYTAKGEREKEGTSGNSGHTHRMGSHFKTLRGGKYIWTEGGCLCDPDKSEYIDGTADWQQGISGFDFVKGGKRFYPVLIPIIDNQAVFARRLYS